MANHVNQLADLVLSLEHVGHGLIGLGYALVALLDAVQGFANQGVDLLGRLGTALGQRPHFCGHHRKTAALLASPGRFHGSVQRQQIGLKRNAFNRGRDLAHAGRAGANGLHRLPHLRDHLLALLADHLVLAAVQGHALRDVAHLLHRAGNVLHGGGGFAQRLHLGLGTVGQGIAALGNGGGRGHELVDFSAHIAHHGLQVDLNLLHALHQLPQRPGQAVGNGGLQIASCNFKSFLRSIFNGFQAKRPEMH